ncbi:bifunctional GNAT family N-acetyltransferase/GrpB family protein [Arthrobacter sp. S41]|uniref:bifunctional GNAT family N-acetyltransferase/GrpB family protein n=1 Tax=Arthrobacter sp. S41 TaxID=2509721 RepID=UPI0013EF66EA|nr:bifunctional GNAT family N-acetyltransferase/GrpB family protein [Arthrobacter sp. S41]
MKQVAAMRHISITDYRDDSAVRRLLVLAASPADEQGLEELLDECQALNVLASFTQSGNICALAAYRHGDKYSLCLEYLAVLPEHQQQGLAHGLLKALRKRHGKSIWATTDKDAIEFYGAIGCMISKSAEDWRWPGTTRYLCTLPYPPLLRSQPEEDPGYEAVGGQLTRGNIRIEEPQAHWASDFANLAALISSALGPLALAVEHTGSTSVVGLPAKPIIDITLLVPDANDESTYVAALQQAGLVFWHREPGWYAHRMFKPSIESGLSDANIHIFSAGSPEYLRMMIFREHLRHNSVDRDAYAAVKRQAAAQIAATDGEDALVMDYNRIKEPFILDLHRRIFTD